MKVTKTEFIISAVKPSQYPEDALPEIALAGRSNVGKSSLINSMINRKNLARTSSKPGKTQTINFFRINDALIFADVPGYGYAKVSKTLRAAWGKMIEEYLLKRTTLVSVIQIVDLRHPPSAEDKSMFSFLKHYGIPMIVVATKADKVGKTQWPKHLKQIRLGLNLQKEDTLLLYSSETKQGKDELWKIITERMSLRTIEAAEE